MSSVGGLTLYPVHYRAALASSLILSPPPHQPPLQSAFPRGEVTELLRSPSRSPGLRSCFSAGGATSAAGECEAPAPDHVPFWFKPVSILGLSLVTAFISTSPGLTMPRTAGPRPP